MSISAKRWLAGITLLMSALSRGASAQSVTPQGTVRASHDSATRIEIYGFAMADAIADFKQNNPDWFDVNRPSRLPNVPKQFGEDGRFWLSARQSKIGTKATIPTDNGDIKIVFEWDLFGVGVDAGQTTIRPRSMYGQWGDFGGGQLESPFMDGEVFPNILEYWGPNGMLFFRNVQLFWQPIHRDDGTRLTFAIERPGASADPGIFGDRIELQNVKARFPLPDFSAGYRLGFKQGYVKLGAMLRYFAWDDVLPDTFDLDGTAWGGGVALSSSFSIGPHDVIRAFTVYGAGVENYFNDAPIDVGAKFQPGNRRTPVTGKPLGDFGMSLYVDHTWNSQFTTAAGYSRVDIANSNAQSSTAFRDGQYASINLLYTPVKRVLFGGEFQWANRKNFGGFSVDDFRLQVSAKYSFSQVFGGR